MSNQNAYAVNAVFRESAQYLQTNLKSVAKALAIPLLISILILIAYDRLFTPDTGENFFNSLFGFDTVGDDAALEKTVADGISGLFAGIFIKYITSILIYLYIQTVLFVSIINLYYDQSNNLNTFSKYIWSRRHVHFFTLFFILHIVVIIASLLADFILGLPMMLISSNYTSSVNDNLNELLFIEYIITVLNLIIYVYILTLFMPSLITAVKDDLPDDYSDREVSSRVKSRIFWVLLPSAAIASIFSILPDSWISDGLVTGYAVGIFAVIITLTLLIFTTIACCIAYHRCVLDPPSRTDQ